MSERRFPLHPKEIYGASPINPEVFVWDIIVTTSRFKHLVWTWNFVSINSSRYCRIIKTSRGISDICDVYLTSSVSDFYVICSFGSSKCQKEGGNSRFSSWICGMMGSTNLQSLMWKRLCVDELLRQKRWKRAIPIVGLLEMTNL